MRLSKAAVDYSQIFLKNRIKYFTEECFLVWTGANGGEMTIVTQFATELPMTCLVLRRLLY